MLKSTIGRELVDDFDFEALAQIAWAASEYAARCKVEAQYQFRQHGLTDETRRLMEDQDTLSNLAYRINQIIVES